MKKGLLNRLSLESVETIEVSDNSTIGMLANSDNLTDALEVVDSNDRVLDSAYSALKTLQEADNQAAVALGEEPRDLETGAKIETPVPNNSIEVATVVAQEAIKFVHQSLDLEYKNKLVSYESLNVNPTYSLKLARETIKDTFNRIITAIINFFKKVAEDISFAFRLLGNYSSQTNKVIESLLRQANNIKNGPTIKTIPEGVAKDIYNKLYIPGVNNVYDAFIVGKNITKLIVKQNNNLSTLVTSLKASISVDSNQKEETYKNINSFIEKMHNDILRKYQDEVNHILSPSTKNVINGTSNDVLDGVTTPCLIDPFKGEYIGYNKKVYDEFLATPKTEPIKQIPEIEFFAYSKYRENISSDINVATKYVTTIDKQNLVSVLTLAKAFNNNAGTAETKARADLKKIDGSIIKDIIRMGETIDKNTYNNSQANDDPELNKYAMNAGVRVATNVLKVYKEFMVRYAKLTRRLMQGIIQYSLANIACYEKIKN